MKILVRALVWSLMYMAVPVYLFAEQQEVSPTQSEDQSKIQWLLWGEEAFQRAEAEDKLILMDLTALWCHACHVMEETTYTDPDIIAMLNDRFVPIRVDTDLRPDIEARYRKGGWPTTSILLPTGEILFQANSLDPEDLGEALQESDVLYRTQKQDLVRYAAEVWAKVEAARKARVHPNGPVNFEVVEQSVLIMTQSFDEVNGGFREAPKFFEPEAITLAFHLGHERSDDALRRMALLTLDRQVRLVDPVWGGFYRYAERADWTHPHYEKMLNIQALNLQNYLEAYQVTRDHQYRKVVEGTIRYVTRFLSDQVNGGFYASQDADAKAPGLPGQFIEGERYFVLGEAQRLAAGVPQVDHAIYTGWNGIMVTSYLKAYQVLGDRHVREFALKTLNRLHRERYREGRGMAHVMVKGQLQGFGWLADQVFFAMALMEAAVTTDEQAYLHKAELLAADLVRNLEDSKGGGFYDRIPSGSDQGLLKFPQKPLEENVHTARLFCDLFYLTGKPAYRDLAERTLQFVLGTSAPHPVALTAAVVMRFLSYPVHIVVVGSKGSETAQELFTQGFRIYAPGKIVRFLDPKVDSLTIGEVTFPKMDEPRAYICTDRLCSQPIENPKDMGDSLAWLLAALSEIERPVPQMMPGPS